jgi:nucleoside triphosphate pyrophosphatase
MADLWRAEVPPVVLASASITRRRLLEAAGIRVTPRPATVDEASLKEAMCAEGVAPGDAAVCLAELKAQRIAAQVDVDCVVVGADQILNCGGRWFDKPTDRVEAEAQLRALSGQRHELWTAAVAFHGRARVWHHLTEARLWLRPCSDGFLAAYLDAAGAQAFASVGAYQVEGLGAQLLARIQGDHFAILGLPVLELLEFLRNQDVLLR